MRGDRKTFLNTKSGATVDNTIRSFIKHYNSYKACIYNIVQRQVLNRILCMNE